MRKTLLLFLALSLAVISGKAANYDKVTLSLTDGSKVTIVMTDELEMSFDEDNLIATGSGEDIRVPKENLSNFMHERIVGEDQDDPQDPQDPQDPDGAGVDSVISEGSFEFNNGFIFHNLPAGSSVLICDLSGKIEFNATVSGDFTIPVDSFSKGLHIVKVNGNIFKILIK